VLWLSAALAALAHTVRGETERTMTARRGRLQLSAVSGQLETTGKQDSGCAGGALLAVLWLSAALAAIVFSLAHTVRGETERTTTALDSLRSYYLATGAIERALLYVRWGPGFRNGDGTPRFWGPATPRVHLEFPSGEAVVEIIPESAKINVNGARPEELYALLLALGADPARAREIALAIVDWRTVMPPGQISAFDHHYLSLSPSFRGRHSSFEEIEELLLVKGMTADLFYGAAERDGQGRLAPRAALRDCVTVYETAGGIDVNSAPAAVLMAIGVPPGVVNAIVEMRGRAPVQTAEQLRALAPGAPGMNRLQIGGGTLLTLRATARLRLPGGGLSDGRRSVAATVKLLDQDYSEPYHVLRWHDNVWVQ
jgi:general secretion pathway protein K